MHRSALPQPAAPAHPLPLPSCRGHLTQHFPGNVGGGGAQCTAPVRNLYPTRAALSLPSAPSNPPSNMTASQPLASPAPGPTAPGIEILGGRWGGKPRKSSLLVQTGKPGPREEERTTQDSATRDHLPRPPSGSSLSLCRLQLHQVPQREQEQHSGSREVEAERKGPAGTSSNSDSVPRRLPLTKASVTVPCPPPTPTCRSRPGLRRPECTAQWSRDECRLLSSYCVPGTVRSSRIL